MLHVFELPPPIRPASAEWQADALCSTGALAGLTTTADVKFAMHASAAVVPRQAIRRGNRPERQQTPASPTIPGGKLFESMRGGGPLLPPPRRLASAEWLSNDDAALEISLEVLQGSQPAPRATGRVRGQKFRLDLLPPIFRSNVSFRFLSDLLPPIQKKSHWRNNDGSTWLSTRQRGGAAARRRKMHNMSEAQKRKAGCTAGNGALHCKKCISKQKNMSNYDTKMGKRINRNHNKACWKVHGIDRSADVPDCCLKGPCSKVKGQRRWPHGKKQNG